MAQSQHCSPAPVFCGRLARPRFSPSSTSEDVGLPQTKLSLLTIKAQVQGKAVTAAQKYLELAITRYKGGVTSYLEVTTAQSAALTDELTAVNILGRRMVDAVTLIQALGGGWDRSSLPARPECCGKLTSTSK